MHVEPLIPVSRPFEEYNEVVNIVPSEKDKKCYACEGVVWKLGNWVGSIGGHRINL